MSPLALADVPPLLKERPWLHGVEDNGGESWFCAAEEIAAFKAKDFSSIENLKTDEMVGFHPASGEVHRSRLKMLNSEFTKILFSIMRGEENVPWPPSSQWIGTHSTKTVEVGGKQYVDVEYTLVSITTDGVDKITIRIDPETKLVNSWKTEDPWDRRSETKVDYLPMGPADIYDLGVPKDAPVVNKLLTGEYKKIFDARQYSRQHLNPYTAFIFRTSPRDSKNRELESIHSVYRIRRNGLRWLIDCLNLQDLDAIKLKMGKDGFAPLKDGKPLVWWKSQVEGLRFEPHELSDGVGIYAFKYKSVDGGNQIEYMWPLSSPLGISDPNPMQLMTPELTTYPRIYVSQANFDMSMDRNSPIGPKNSLMVTNGKSGPEAFRIWLDPQRGFAGIRTETERDDSIATAVIDEMEQSPTGIWYATRVREGRVNSAGDELKEVNTDKNGKKLGTSLVLYLLDFTTPISDEVFATKEKIVKPQLKK